jgi:uncharacterized repeat protein (TIGR02543 family)
MKISHAENGLFRTLAITLAVALALGMAGLPPHDAAYADPGESAQYGMHGEFTVESTGTLGGVSCEGNILTITNTEDVVSVSNTDGGAAEIEGNILLFPGDEKTVKLVLKNIRLKGLIPEAGAVELSSGNAEVELEGSSYVTGVNNNAGFQTRQGTLLTIKSGSGGSLTAKAEAYGAGIGAGSRSNAGDICIESGIVLAAGGQGGAGIGAGSAADVGNITINGGTVVATGGALGAGIGGGNKAEAGEIRITGGVVTASVTGYSGAGIGGGVNKSSVSGITITGGRISAEAAMHGGAAIGGGASGSAAGRILISGGTITATAHKKNGIGSGDLSEAGEVIIVGGTVRTKGVDPSPVDRDGARVYLNIIAFPRNVEGLPVSEGAIDGIACSKDEEPGDSSFGVTDVTVDGDNNLRFYLPGRKSDDAGISLVIGDGLYEAKRPHVVESFWMLTLFPNVEAPGPLDAVYLQTLSEIPLPERWAFTEDGSAEVGSVGVVSHPAIFTPEDKDYSPVIKTVRIIVVRKDPEAAPHTSVAAVYGQTLGDISLTECWAWDEDEDTPVGDAGERVHPATYTHPDADGYNTQSQDVIVGVAKAAPSVSPPSSISTIEGKTLGDLALPGGWAFDEDSGTSVGAIGPHLWQVTYTPEDADNWEEIHTTVLVTVGDGSVKEEPPAIVTPETATPETTAPTTPEIAASAAPYAPESAFPATPKTANPATKDKALKIKLKGAKASKVITATIGKKIGKLPAPGKRGYKFTGWYTKKKGGVKISSSYEVKAGTPDVLYAQWKKNAVYGKVSGCYSLFVRVYPSPHSNMRAVIGHVKRGASVKILAKEGGWYRMSSGKLKGYVWGRYVAVPRG